MSKGTHTPYIGSYIVDDFGSGVDSWWDSEFKTNWTRTLVDGEYVMIRGSDGVDQLTPANDLTNGFVFEGTIKCGATNVGANRSVHLHLLDSSGTLACGIYWAIGSGLLRWFGSAMTALDTVSGVNFVAFKEVSIKMERTAGTNTVTGYYDIGSGWVAFANPQTVSGDVGLEVDGADEHGFTEFDLWAGDGLPNP